MAIFPDADPSKRTFAEWQKRAVTEREFFEAMPPLSEATREVIPGFIERVSQEPAVRATVGGLSFAVVEEGERWDGCPNCAEKDAKIATLRQELNEVGERQRPRLGGPERSDH